MVDSHQILQWILCLTLVSSSLMYPPLIFLTWQSLTKCISHLEITTIAHRGWEIQLNVSMKQCTYLSSSYCIPLMKSNCSLVEEYLDTSGTLTLVPSWQLFTEINNSLREISMFESFMIHYPNNIAWISNNMKDWRALFNHKEYLSLCTSWSVRSQQI